MAAQIFTPGSWFKRGDLTEAMRTSVSSARPLFQTSCKEQANHLLTKQEASAKTGPVPRARIELATHGSSGDGPSDSPSFFENCGLYDLGSLARALIHRDARTRAREDGGAP